MIFLFTKESTINQYRSIKLIYAATSIGVKPDLIL